MMKKGIILMTVLFTLIGSNMVTTVHADSTTNTGIFTPSSHGVDH